MNQSIRNRHEPGYEFIGPPQEQVNALMKRYRNKEDLYKFLHTILVRYIIFTF